MFAEERNQKNIQSDETEKKPFIQINHIRKVFIKVRLFAFWEHRVRENLLF